MLIRAAQSVKVKESAQIQYAMTRASRGSFSGPTPCIREFSTA
jgi:hypothetical protein